MIETVKWAWGGSGVLMKKRKVVMRACKNSDEIRGQMENPIHNIDYHLTFLRYVFSFSVLSNGRDKRHKNLRHGMRVCSQRWRMSISPRKKKKSRNWKEK